MRYISCTVGPSHDGSPLWSALEEQLHVSRALIRRARAAGEGLLLDGKPTYTTATVHVGQTISLNVSDQTGGSAVEPQPGPVEVIYEDDDLLAVNKPAGQVVHPCPGHRSYTLGNFVLHHLAQTSSGCNTLYPVHRLDLGTSGLLLYAKHAYAHQRLQATLHSTPDAGIGRTYLALCSGHLDEASGIVDAPILRPDEHNMRRTVDPQGKRALTHYQALAPIGPDLTLVMLRLETGRTHQIRVHMAHIGHPLLGDALYATPSKHIDRPALHSWRSALVQPVTGEMLHLEAPLPSDMAAIVGKQWPAPS